MHDGDLGSHGFVDSWLGVDWVVACPGEFVGGMGL